MDSKVIAKERNSEDEKGISAQTDWCKDEARITKYTEEEFFSWLLGSVNKILEKPYERTNEV